MIAGQCHENAQIVARSAWKTVMEQPSGIPEVPQTSTQKDKKLSSGANGGRSDDLRMATERVGREALNLP